MKETPFNPSGFAMDEGFTDRVDELKWLVGGARRHAKLLAYGPRRMGKSSCLLRAGEILKREHDGHVLYVDLSRYSNLVDAANALLKEADAALHGWSRWRNFLIQAMKGVTFRAGTISVGLEMKDRDKSDHVTVFLEVLDSLNTAASKRKGPLVVAIDEFQDIVRLGADRAEWALRSALQGHRSLGYFLAGSEAHLIEKMTSAQGAFFELLETKAIGPIAREEMARWIDTQFARERLKAAGVGAACCEYAGDRTRDIVDLARRTYERALSKRSADRTTVEAALEELIADKEDPFFRIWSSLPTAQQAVLQAIAAEHGRELGATAVRRRFGIKSTGESSHAANALVEKGHLQRLGRGAFVFDSPFFKRWVKGLSAADAA